MSVGPICNASGERLDFSLSQGDALDLVVIGHGVTANKDRDWAVTLAHELERSGIASLRFSFSETESPRARSGSRR